jgi:HSP20 family protein
VAERKDIDRLQDEIEELFSELWQVPRFARQRQGFRPQVDCYRTADPPELTVVIELPGVDPADVQISAMPRSLVVSGVRRRPRDPPRVYQQMEIDYGTFQRKIVLAEDIDTKRARASYKDGLLKVVLPIASRPPRLVKVTVEVRDRD